MNVNIGDKALITTNDWFYAPDGRSYKAAYGTVKAVHTSEETLGVKTNARSTNWYVEIGNMTIAGCQIFYLVKTDKVNLRRTADYQRLDSTGEFVESERPSNIYNADEE